MGFVRTILAGGQTGVDAAALCAALRHGFGVGGWCPPDGCNEAGPIPAEFGLTPTPEERSAGAPEVPRSLRTEWNVRDADATLIVLAEPGGEPPDRGTAWTRTVAEQLGRPLLVITPGDDAARAVVAWLGHIAPQVLNVAGPSESAAPGVGRAAFDLLDTVFASLQA